MNDADWLRKRLRRRGGCLLVPLLLLSGALSAGRSVLSGGARRDDVGHRQPALPGDSTRKIKA